VVQVVHKSPKHLILEQVLGRLLGSYCFIAVALSLLPGAQARAASFDCSAKQLSSVELTICAYEPLSDEDSRLKTLYETAKTLSKDPELVSSQRAWIKKRNLCGPYGDCLLNEYHLREKQLLRIVAAHSPDPFRHCPEDADVTSECVAQLLHVLAKNLDPEVRLDASLRLSRQLTDNGVDTCQDSTVVESHLSDIFESLDDPNRDVAQNTVDILGFEWSGEKVIACCMSDADRKKVVAALETFKSRHSDEGINPRVDTAIDRDLKCDSR